MAIYKDQTQVRFHLHYNEKYTKGYLLSLNLAGKVKKYPGMEHSIVGIQLQKQETKGMEQVSWVMLNSFEKKSFAKKQIFKLTSKNDLHKLPKRAFNAFG